jgi:FkbM family methyltransferase
LNNLTEKEVKIICTGLSDKEGNYTYQTEGINNQNKTNTGGFQWHSAKNGQEFTTLDELWRKRILNEIGFFWLDAQWMEPQILRGGKRFLKKCKPYILIEYDRILDYHKDNMTVKSYDNVTFVSHKPLFDDILIKIT